jgi:hypothetical protein
MKWWVVQPDETAFNFGPADHMVDFARVHGIKVRGHTAGGVRILMQNGFREPLGASLHSAYRCT